VHRTGSLQTKLWGTKEFSAIDPNGVVFDIPAMTGLHRKIAMC